MYVYVNNIRTHIYFISTELIESLKLGNVWSSLAYESAEQKPKNIP